MPTPRDEKSTLDYETPPPSPRGRSFWEWTTLSKYDFAACFAVLAILAAILSASIGYGLLERGKGKGTGLREDARRDSTRIFVISGILLVPGLWYGYIAIRRGDE